MTTQDEFDKFLCEEAGVPYVPRSITGMRERALSTEVAKLIAAPVIDGRPQLVGHCFYESRRRSGAGWVDWVIQGAGGVLFRELKSMNGKRTDMQRWVGGNLAGHGLDYAVWTPMDLHDGTIRRQLDAIAAAP